MKLLLEGKRFRVYRLGKDDKPSDVPKLQPVRIFRVCSNCKGKGVFEFT